MADNHEIWRYVPLSDFSRPTTSSGETLRGLRRLWKALGKLWPLTDPEPGGEEGYEPVVEAELEKLTPRLEVDELTSALRGALDGWPGSAGRESPIAVVVGPPGLSTGEAVAALARRREWDLLPSPARADLVERQDPVDEALEVLRSKAGEPLAVPRLERWLVRCEPGLQALRALLASLREPARPLLIGCDSWAWSFLANSVGVDDLVRDPLALQAIDGEGLAAWLAPPVAAAGRVCRSTEKPEKPVFADPSREEGRGDGVSPSLEELASAARGNPAVALGLWRRCLRAAHRDENEGGGDAERVAGEDLWVAPLGRSEKVVSPRLASELYFVLYATLLHAGLERELLTEVLPFSRHDLSRWVRDLEGEGLLAGDDVLRVPLSAYAAVRDALDSKGFLGDGF